MANADPFGAEDIQMPRRNRELGHVSRTDRDPAGDDSDQEMTGAFARDMRLIAQPLIGDDAHAHGSFPNSYPLRSHSDPQDRKSTRLNSSHSRASRMPSSA